MSFSWTEPTNSQSSGNDATTIPAVPEFTRTRLFRCIKEKYISMAGAITLRCWIRRCETLGKRRKTCRTRLKGSNDSGDRSAQLFGGANGGGQRRFANSDA